jgi:hypothetical protein
MRMVEGVQQFPIEDLHEAVLIRPFDEKILLGLLIGLDRVTVEHCPSQNGSDMKDGRSAAFFNIFK